jgi:hypothetical protein
MTQSDLAIQLVQQDVTGQYGLRIDVTGDVEFHGIAPMPDENIRVLAQELAEAVADLDAKAN